MIMPIMYSVRLLWFQRDLRLSMAGASLLLALDVGFPDRFSCR
jgi:hypothetical protein